MIKIIGIGNKLMCDDGIALYVLDEIRNNILNLNASCEIISGETDYMYCLENIKNHDVVIIIDSTIKGYKPGRVIAEPFHSTNKLVYSSAHQVSLPDLIFKYNDKVSVYTIGIEAYEISYQYDLSDYLKARFKTICQEVLQSIEKIMKENHYA